MMFGQNLNAGAKVRVQVDSGNSAAPYTIDVADFFNVGARDHPDRPARSR